MRALKVVLFIEFLLVAIFGLIGLFLPTSLSAMGMTAKDADPAYTRVVATGTIAFALAIWFAFRDPRKNTAIILAALAWLGLEGLVLLISGIAGTIPWASALSGVIVDWVLVALLAIFYLRVEKAT